MSYTCHLESCSNREYLPFQCNNCKNFYCRKHHPYDKHECEEIKTKYTRYVSEEEIQSKKICSNEGCNSNINLEKCNICKKDFCNKHAGPWHKCIKVKKKKKTSLWGKFKGFFK